MFPKILTQVRGIPKGRVATYGDVAAASGHPGAARQVVWALRAGEGVPWHRVVGAGGKIRLTGENGFEQRLRLRSEGVTIAGDKIDLKRFGHSFSEASGKAGASDKSGSAKLKKFGKP
jgi:methylated-DNA-protein-cysteine methyltransferase-like protein